MTMKSADDLIVQTENQKLGIVAPEQPKEQKIVQKAESPESDLGKEPKSVDEQVSDQKESEPKEEASEQNPTLQEKPQKEGANDASLEETDDYGNPVGKGKTYTEEQVNAMVRDRLARDRQSRAQNPHQEQQIQDAAKDFKSDPNSEESWEVQLESFVEKTINKVTQKQQDNEWRQREEASQAEFETKFTQGMGRYNDFREVVSAKPISNSMMMATKSMPDPAAFLYAACKNHPAEITKISEIKDPVAQMVEIGRLEERMKKPRVATKAPTPSKKVTGDASNELPQLDIDSRIREHAKSKIMR